MRDKKWHVQIDPEWTAEKELCTRRGMPYTAPAQKIEDDEYQAEEAASISVGSRCEVDPGAKRGEIKSVFLNLHLTLLHK